VAKEEEEEEEEEEDDAPSVLPGVEEVTSVGSLPPSKD